MTAQIDGFKPRMPSRSSGLRSKSCGVAITLQIVAGELDTPVRAEQLDLTMHRKLWRYFDCTQILFSGGIF
jgi:hypothetical protein